MTLHLTKIYFKTVDMFSNILTFFQLLWNTHITYCICFCLSGFDAFHLSTASSIYTIAQELIERSVNFIKPEKLTRTVDNSVKTAYLRTEMRNSDLLNTKRRSSPNQLRRPVIWRTVYRLVVTIVQSAAILSYSIYPCSVLVIGMILTIHSIKRFIFIYRAFHNVLRDYKNLL